jgi:hypothetical protein
MMRPQPGVHNAHDPPGAHFNDDEYLSEDDTEIPGVHATEIPGVYTEITGVDTVELPGVDVAEQDLEDPACSTNCCD